MHSFFTVSYHGFDVREHNPSFVCLEAFNVLHTKGATGGEVARCRKLLLKSLTELSALPLHLGRAYSDEQMFFIAHTRSLLSSIQRVLVLGVGVVEHRISTFSIAFKLDTLFRFFVCFT